MEDKKTKVEEYCKRVDQIIREMDEDRPLEEIKLMINELRNCKKNLEEIKTEYEKEEKRLFEKNGGGTDSFEALATENMLKKINWVLEEIPSFVELAQTVIDGNNNREESLQAQNLPERDLPEEEQIPEIEVIKVVPIEPIQEEEVQPKTSLDDLPQFFGKGSEETEIEKEGLNTEQDSNYGVEDEQDRGAKVELNFEPEVEEYGVRAGEEKEELQRAQVITIDMGKPVEQGYLELAGRIVEEREGMKDPAKVVENGSGDSRNVMLIINKKLMPKEPALESKSQNGLKDYERERGDEE